MATAVYSSNEHTALVTSPQAQHVGNIKSRVIRPVPTVRCLSTVTVALAFACIFLGITAAGISAWMSYILNPLWTGLLFMLPGSLLGTCINLKQTGFRHACKNAIFLVLTMMSAIASLQLLYASILAVLNESQSCVYMPGLEYYNNGFCPEQWVRTLVDAVISLCALSVLVLNILSISLTMYETYNCCFSCCLKCCDLSSPMTIDDRDVYIHISDDYEPGTSKTL